MKLKKIKINKKRIFIIGIVLIVALILSFNIYKAYSESSVSYAIDNGNQTDTNHLTFYRENDLGEYEAYNGSAFENNNYILNAEESYCKYGSELIYDFYSNELSINSIGQDNCYLYYDLKNYLKDEILLNNNASKDTIISLNNLSKASVSQSYYDNQYGSDKSKYVVDSGFYKTSNETSTNYYFRGEVNNNWVYFAGIYWRIIRIDESGNIRMIYSGTTAPTSSQSYVMTGVNTQIGAVQFNRHDTLGNKVRLDLSIEGMGYVYAENDLHGLSKNSQIKESVDAWYNSTLKSDYEKYLTESMFCVDRTASLDDKFNSYIDYVNTSFDDYKDKVIYMGPADRIRYGTINPSLECPLNIDKLNLYAGLINADEVAYAGGATNINNPSYYLYTGMEYWTISPIFHINRTAYVYSVYDTGHLGSRKVGGEAPVVTLPGIRPVISLNSSVLFSSGDGTYSNPYKIIY